MTFISGKNLRMKHHSAQRELELSEVDLFQKDIDLYVNLLKMELKTNSGELMFDKGFFRKYLYCS